MENDIILKDIKKNEPLRKYCTYAVGGPADFLFIAKTGEEIVKAVRFAKDNNLNFHIIGKGSNILFDDNGFRGLIIINNTSQITFEDNLVTADSGVTIAKLIQESLKNNLSKLEKWISLPGTVGGAVFGNAGCNGLETKDIFVSAQVLNPKTLKVSKNLPSKLKFAYRSSSIKETDNIILSATFKLEKLKLSDEERNKIMRESRLFRIKTQPFGSSGGSFFKNPSQENRAGLLIDKVGLKGKQMGGAKISEKHANFILNIGGATSKDILKLAKLAQDKVKQKFQVTLIPEVQIFSQHGKIII